MLPKPQHGAAKEAAVSRASTPTRLASIAAAPPQSKARTSQDAVHRGHCLSFSQLYGVEPEWNRGCCGPAGLPDN
jgi:hypothetical protein